MGKISLKGIIIGGIVDVVTSAILGIPLVAYMMSTLDLAHTPRDQLQGAVVSAIHASSTFYIAQIVVGLACSMLGGYVAARLAKREERLNGALSSFLCVGIGMYSIASGKESGSNLAQLLVLVVSPVFAFVGGYLRSYQVRQRVG